MCWSSCADDINIEQKLPTQFLRLLINLQLSNSLGKSRIFRRTFLLPLEITPF